MLGVLFACCQGAASSGNAGKNASQVRIASNDSAKLVPDKALNDASCVLAGLTVDKASGKLYALTRTKEWKNHARYMDQIWNVFRQTAPRLVAFSQTELEDINTRCHTLFYPFGGPDFLFANAFFPEMDTYVLIGLEPAGTAPKVKHPSAETYRLYQNAVSPHLAARIEGNPVEKDVIMSAWERVTAAYPYVTMEGSGGIMCPIRHDEKAVYYLEDIIRWLRLPVLVIADAGLGTINRVVTTCEYIRHRNISVKGIILNHWKGGVMEEDNVEMIEEITGVKVLARVKQGDTELDIDPKTVISLYE